jgi:hypothetical protein
MPRKVKPKNWENLPDEEILQMRVRDLGLRIPGYRLEPLIERLYQQLDAKGVAFHPPCYLADEWLCPDKVPIVGIPFCLAHPRLMHIEQSMMFEVEGGQEQACMRLLRHESGHALNYAYLLYRRTRWRELFGPFSAKYSDSYSFQPYSRRYVVHLEDNYAQSHPDEDFAETFAVWLDPNSAWQQKYRGWPVMKKLRYVDRLAATIADRTPLVTVRENPPWAASRMTSTIAAHYEKKRRALGPEFKGFYDDCLRRLFPPVKHSVDSRTKASKLLSRYRRQLINSVTRWTGHRKYDIHQLINRLIVRCSALDLYAGAVERDSIIGVASLLTAIASNTLKIARRQQSS